MVTDRQSDHVEDEVQELVWALVDECATDTQVRRLEELLLENEQARRIYVMCMQMHADLHFLLNGRQERLAANIEQLLSSERTSRGKKPDQTARPTALPVADLPPTAHDMPHSNGLSR